jgi:ankyrin repeat protein
LRLIWLIAADLDKATTGDGDTALDIAKKTGHIAIVALLAGLSNHK